MDGQSWLSERHLPRRLVSSDAGNVLSCRADANVWCCQAASSDFISSASICSISDGIAELLVGSTSNPISLLPIFLRCPLVAPFGKNSKHRSAHASSPAVGGKKDDSRNVSRNMTLIHRLRRFGFPRPRLPAKSSIYRLNPARCVCRQSYDAGFACLPRCQQQPLRSDEDRE